MFETFLGVSIILRTRIRTAKGRQTHQKTGPQRQIKKKKTLDLTRRGDSNVLAQGPITGTVTSRMSRNRTSARLREGVAKLGWRI